jgi:hypothetical protein
MSNMADRQRKKFKDTKLGQFLRVKAPKVLDVVGDALPDEGVLGIVKNLIENSTELREEDKQMLNNVLREMQEVEVRDRESARQREVDIAKLGKTDFMFLMTGAIGLAVFCFIVYAIVYLQVPDDNKEIWIHLIGISEGVVLSIFGYYFGSSIKRN